MRAILFLLVLLMAVDAGAQRSNRRLLMSQPLAAAAGGGGTGRPAFVSATNKVDVATQFNTNSIDVSSDDISNKPLLISIWHCWNASGNANPQTNLAGGNTMTILGQTNSYSGTQGTNNGFGVAYFYPTTNGTYRVVFNSHNSSPSEVSFCTMLYTNVNQSTAFGTAVIDFVGASRTGATNTVNTTSGSDLGFSALGWNTGAIGSVGSGETRRALADPSSNDASAASSEKNDEGATTTMRWSGFTAGVIVTINAALKGP